MLYPKKVGTLPLNGGDEVKQTNEIKIAAPMLDAIEIEGRTITAGALLTQRDLARYLVEDRGAHYHFTVKSNQPELFEAIAFYFQSNPNVADFTQTGRGEHGRIETRKIWVTTNSITISTFSMSARPEQILADNRGHWRVESCHYIIDWNYDEDRCQIRTGFGPENITRLRRFAIGLLKSKQRNETIPEMMKKLLLNTRAVFDYTKMTRNSNQISVS